jgi:hypothetical protein
VKVFIRLPRIAAGSAAETVGPRRTVSSVGRIMKGAARNGVTAIGTVSTVVGNQRRT